MSLTFPWLKNYDPGVPAEVAPATQPVPALLEEAALQMPQATALMFLGRRLSYAQLADQVSRLAQSFHRLGLQPGDRVGLFLPNCPQMVIAYYAALRLGAVGVMLNPLLGPKELAHQIADSGARGVVALDHLLPKLHQVEAQIKLSHLIITRIQDYLPFPLNWLYPLKAWREGLATGFTPAPGRFAWRDLLKSGTPVDLPPPPRPEDLALLQYTGGTTGIPKAAMLTHGNLMVNVAQVNAWMPRAQYGQERVMGLLPFTHVFGLTACLNWPLSKAAAVILLPRFDLKQFLGTLKKYRPTVLPGVPALFIALINHPDLPNYDFTSMWACVSGSAPLPLEVRDRFEAITNCRIMEGYGLTEASPVTHFNTFSGLRPPGSIGLPMPSTEARIMDAETGLRELPVGEVGELVLKGPQVMAGYWNNPGETALVLKNGWLYTGDLARVDEQGFFYIIDRKKDLIISGGYKIFPREVEEILYQYPGVKEAVAVGAPDPYRGEVVKVVIVPQEGAQLTEAAIQDFLKANLAAYKIPKIVEFREELPKSLVGKVLRRVLKPEDAPEAKAPPDEGPTP